MKKFDYSNHVQKEAILNECKGNLFEFLMAQKFAEKSEIESQFLLSLPKNFKNQLLIYEGLIRDSEPKLLSLLPLLAKATTEEVWFKLELGKLHFLSWNVIGKMVNSSEAGLWNETDLVGTYSLDHSIEKRMSFSLKITKHSSFTNTKSAGAKSFIIKYFTQFGPIVNEHQRLFNNLVEDSFLQMTHKLYEETGLSFKGKFDSEWTHNFSELPGELPENLKSIVHDSYHRLAVRLHVILKDLLSIDRNEFCQSLKSLCGFGADDITQVNCFHNDYELKKIAIYRSSDLFSENTKIEILPMKVGVSSIEIKLNNVLIQLRVKPMNKFTSAAYKINCAIKVED